MNNSQTTNTSNTTAAALSTLIVEGGAMRSVFSAGLLDGFLDKQFNPFDMYVGVSAGAFNLGAYLAGVSGKSLHIYTSLALQKEFISHSSFLRGGHFIDLDWLVNTIFHRGYIDLHTVYCHKKPFYVVVTNVITGKAMYVKTDINNLIQSIQASASLPLLYRGFPKIDGSPMTDGGVADGIPVKMAIEQGAKRIMVIRSRQQSYLKKDSLFHKYIRWKVRKYPKLRATMQQRIALHEECMTIIRNPPPGVKIVEICPPDDFSVGRFCRNPVKLNKGYALGYQLADEAIKLWEIEFPIV